MQYAIMVFVVLIGLGGLKLYNNGDESGYSRGKAEALEEKNAKLAQLNQDNIVLQNRMGRERRQRAAVIQGVENEYKGKINANRAAHDTALNQYGNTVRVLLAEAENRGNDKNSGGGERIAAFISGLDGTEGSKLTPETRRDLELLSIDADKTAILLGLCQTVAENDRK